MSRAEVRLRDAREGDRPYLRAVTLAAYAQYRSSMPPAAWSGLVEAVLAALEVWDGVEWIVAESAGTIVGSVVLYPEATDAYRGASAPNRARS